MSRCLSLMLRLFCFVSLLLSASFFVSFPPFFFFFGDVAIFGYLKKNQNAPRPSEHPPVREEKMSKRLGGIKGCKYKTSSWHLNGFPDGNNIGSIV